MQGEFNSIVMTILIIFLIVGGGISLIDTQTENITNIIQYINNTNITSYNITSVNSSQVIVPKINNNYLDRLNEWISSTTSSGKVSGGTLTDNSDGSITISSGVGFIRRTDDDIGEIYSFNWSETTLILNDNSMNYVYVDYNSGAPQVLVSTSIPTDHNTKILLGGAYRNGLDVHLVTSGQDIANFQTKIVFKDLDINGRFQRATGLIISEGSSRTIKITSGTIYAGQTKLTIPSFDSSGTDTFSSYYRDGSGGWIETNGLTQINNLYYDDGSGTLASLGNNRYGVYWIYRVIDGDVYMVYGRGNYLSSDADASQPPSDLPDELNEIGGLIGKIIIQKGDTSFTSIQSAFEVVFSPSLIIEHNDLSGIQGGTSDEYYHLSASAYNNLYQQDQEVLTTSNVTFNNVTTDVIIIGNPPSDGGYIASTTNGLILRGNDEDVSAYFYDGTQWLTGITSLNRGGASCSAGVCAGGTIRFDDYTSCELLSTDTNGQIQCGTDAVDDADNDPTNELQTLQEVTNEGSTTTAQITTGGMSVSVPSTTEKYVMWNLAGVGNIGFYGSTNSNRTGMYDWANSKNIWYYDADNQMYTMYQRPYMYNGIQYDDRSMYLWYFDTANTWGMYWDTTANTWCYRGSGTDRFCIDGDNGDITSSGDLTVGNEQINDNIGMLELYSNNGDDSYIEIQSNDNTYGVIIREDIDNGGSEWGNIEVRDGKMNIGFNNANGGMTLNDYDCMRIDTSGGTCSSSESLMVDQDLYVGYGDSGDSDTVYFDVGYEYLRWDEPNSRFVLSDDLYAVSVLGDTVKSTGGIYPGNAGEYISWDTTNAWFYFSDDVRIAGSYDTDSLSASYRLYGRSDLGMFGDGGYGISLKAPEDIQIVTDSNSNGGDDTLYIDDGSTSYDQVVQIGNQAGDDITIKIPDGRLCIDSDGYTSCGISDGYGKARGWLTGSSDIAENYEVNHSLIDIAKAGYVTCIQDDGLLGICQKNYDVSVAGIISTQPGFIANSDCNAQLIPHLGNITEDYLLDAGNTPIPSDGWVYVTHTSENGDDITTHEYWDYYDSYIMLNNGSQQRNIYRTKYDTLVGWKTDPNSCEFYKPIALKGKVPAWVNCDRYPVKRGDMLVPEGGTGMLMGINWGELNNLSVIMAIKGSASIVGKALENCPVGQNQIMVWVN